MATKVTPETAAKASEAETKVESAKAAAATSAAPKATPEKISAKPEEKTAKDEVSGGEGADVQKGSIRDSGTDMLSDQDNVAVRRLDLAKLLKDEGDLVYVKLRFSNEEIINKLQMMGNTDNLFYEIEKDGIAITGSTEDVKALLSHMLLETGGYNENFRIDMDVRFENASYRQSVFVVLDSPNGRSHYFWDDGNKYYEVSFAPDGRGGQEFFSLVDPELPRSDVNNFDNIINNRDNVVVTTTTTPTNTNDAPVVNAPLVDQSATEDAVFSYQFASNSFTDVDVGDTLTYSATLSNGSPLPSWLSFNASTRTFSGTPDNGDVGTITVRVTTSDGTTTVTDDFDITTANTNDAPVVSTPLVDQGATEDAVFSYQFASNSFTDADGDTLTYSATLSNGSPLPSWLSFNASTRTFSGTPDNGDVGTITVRVTTSDGTTTVTDDFDITTANTNDAPVVSTPLVDQGATEDAVFSYQFASNSFTDADGDTLTYSATLSNSSPLPSWLSFNASTRTFSGTPDNGDVGTITVRVTTSDGTTTVTDDFDITTTNTNDAPVVNAPLVDQSATEDAVFSYQFASNSFTDVDVGDTLTYSATLSNGSPLPSWLSFNASTRTFSGTPDNGDVGTITVRVTTSDGTTTVTDDFDITTANTNDAPVVSTPLVDQGATEDAVFSYQFASNSFTDADGDTLTYSATLSNGSPLPSWLSFNASTRTFSGTPDNGDVGTITVRVTTSDGTTTVTDDFDITTANTNDAPVVSNIGGSVAYTQNATAEVIDSSVTIADVDDTNIESAQVWISGGGDFAASGGIDALNFVDQNGITGSYNAATGILTLTGAATLAQYEAALESVTFSSTSGTAGNRTISFRVNDGDTDSNTQTATITYTNAAPSLTGVLTDQNVAGSTAISGWSFDASTAFGGGGTYSLAVTDYAGGAVTGFSIDANTGAITNTSSVPASSTAYIFTVTKTDGVTTVNETFDLFTNNGALVAGSTIGNDTISGTASAERFWGGDGTDSISTGNGGDIAHGGEGNDTVVGGTGADTLYGGQGNDNITGSTGNDLFFGGDGNDTITGSNTSITTTDTIVGGAGTDAVSVTGAGITYTTTNMTGVESLSVLWASNITLTNAAVGSALNTTMNVSTHQGSVLNASAVTTSGYNVNVTGFGTNALSGLSTASATTGAGNDTITGTMNWIGETITASSGDGNDSINLTTGMNSTVTNVNAGMGDDTFYSLTGGSLMTIDLGEGNNRATVTAGSTVAANATITAGSGNDSISARAGSTSVNAGDGNNTIVGTASWADHDVTITSGTGHDSISATLWHSVTSNYSINSGSGNDTISVVQGLGTIDAGEGNNIISVTNLQFAGSGNTTITSGSGNDSITARAGGTSINAGDGDNTITGTGDHQNQHITIISGTGADLISTTSYDSTSIVSITSGAGVDTISVTNGTARISSGDGNDSVTTGSANDQIEGGAGADYLNASTGTDTLSYAGSSAAVNVNGTTVSGGDAQGDTVIGFEAVIGSANNDTLAGYQTIVGGGGNDSITGTSSADSLSGSAGNDSISAGVGADTVDGGANDGTPSWVATGK